MDNKNGDSKFESVQTHIQQLTGFALKLAIVILLSVVAWRIAWAGFSLDLSKFDFSDLLAMILALFAVGMSVAFYFKTTDSSNQFYDNIYNFTQKTSEILGRIEERFGERLKHLDEGYFKMQSHFEDFSNSPKEIQKQVEETAGKEAEEKRKLEATNEQLKIIMDDLFNKAKMQETEQKQIKHKFESLTAERNSAQERIRIIEEERDRMQMQLRGMEQAMSEGVDNLPPMFVKELFQHPELRHLIMDGAPPELIQRHFRRVITKFSEEILIRLQEAGIVNGRRELTSAGALVLRTMARQLFR